MLKDLENTVRFTPVQVFLGLSRLFKFQVEVFYRSHV